MYTGQNCTGKILKSGVYGGISAAIVILIISIATVVYFLIKANQNEKGDPFARDEDDKWYQDNEDSYVNRGFSSLGMGQAFGEGSSVGSEISKEKFTPNLETVDTTIQVKIQRPQVSFA
ncbi:mucin-17-like [Mixophyes fleayi]|uniref:mucin-17-like n=1 Tax=Mixophyes fleayi TaxID=3061075 RepID=UPI003F4DE38D